MLSITVIAQIRQDLSNLVQFLDYCKSLPDFNNLDRDLIMRLSLIRTLSDQVVKKL